MIAVLGAVLGAIFSYWIVYWFFASFFPFDVRSKQIKPSEPVKQVVFRNMLISFVSGPIIWLILPDLSIYIIDSYILRFLLCVIIADGWFYMMHRLLHTPSFYKWHKQHHQFYIPYPLVALYASPVEAIFCDFMSVGLGPALLKMNAIEMQVWMISMALHSLLIHSTCSYGSDHVEHHGKVSYNFGLFPFFDWLLGTYKKDQKIDY